MPQNVAQENAQDTTAAEGRKGEILKRNFGQKFAEAIDGKITFQLQSLKPFGMLPQFLSQHAAMILENPFERVEDEIRQLGLPS